MAVTYTKINSSLVRKCVFNMLNLVFLCVFSFLVLLQYVVVIMYLFAIKKGFFKKLAVF